jgi:tRNA (guanine-N7-)-methyltransferase
MSDDSTADRPARRGVRSFVRRQGRFTVAQRRAMDQLWPRYGLELSQGRLELSALFPDCCAFSVEIGFGMGDTLIELAAREPHTGIIGIDVHQPGVGKLLAAAEEAKLRNIRLYCADALDVLREAIADDVLDTVLMFFPDPWPKKRHHKRRLLQQPFAELVARKLKIGGVFHLATDCEGYAQQMLDVLSAVAGLENVAGAGRFAPRPASRPQTRFEERGLRLGHVVRDLLFRRVAR